MGILAQSILPQVASAIARCPKKMKNSNLTAA
jgi:hypothetical protein